MNVRKAHNIWIEQCEAAQTIKARFGLTAAFDYLVGEKLISCASAASRHPDFARELPRFVPEVRRMFPPDEIGAQLAQIECSQNERNVDVWRGRMMIFFVRVRPQSSSLDSGMCPSQAAHQRCSCARPGAAMSKHETCSPSAFGSTSENLPRQLRGDADLAGRQPSLGDIGILGLGHMCAAVAANLVASGRR